MSKHINILVTGVGSTTAISVIKGLRRQEEFRVSVVGVDINDRTDIAGSNFCDRFFKVPPATDESNYLNALHDIVASESVDLLVPIVDIELEVIARNINELEDQMFVLLSPYTTIATCNDKLKTHEFFQKIDVPTPKTAEIEGSLDITDTMAALDIDFPIIAKPRRGVSSRDVYEIRGIDELSIIRRISEPLIQEKAKGQEYTIDAFCDGQQLICAVPRTRVETRAGISYKGVTVHDMQLASYAKKIVEGLHIKGPANIQCFKNDDEIRFLEINPRFSGSLPLTIAAGVNTPLLALRLCVGQVLDPLNEFDIVKMCRYWEEIFYDRT